MSHHTIQKVTLSAYFAIPYCNRISIILITCFVLNCVSVLEGNKLKHIVPPKSVFTCINFVWLCWERRLWWLGRVFHLQNQSSNSRSHGDPKIDQVMTLIDESFLWPNILKYFAKEMQMMTTNPSYMCHFASLLHCASLLVYSTSSALFPYVLLSWT